MKQVKVSLVEVWGIVEPVKEEENEEQEEYRVDLKDPLFANVEEYRGAE